MLCIEEMFHAFCRALLLLCWLSNYTKSCDTWIFGGFIQQLAQAWHDEISPKHIRSWCYLSGWAVNIQAKTKMYCSCLYSSHTIITLYQKPKCLSCVCNSRYTYACHNFANTFERTWMVSSIYLNGKNSKIASWLIFDISGQRVRDNINTTANINEWDVKKSCSHFIYQMKLIINLLYTATDAWWTDTFDSCL